MSQTDDPSTVHWYYRIDGKDQGPVLISRLRQMAHRGKLTSTDLVRKGKTGEWVPASTYKEIDTLAAQPVIEQPIAEPIPHVVAPVLPRQNRIGDFVGNGIEYLQDVSSELVRAFLDRTQFIRVVLSYLALATVAGVFFYVTVGARLLERPPAVGDPYSTCNSLWEELKEIRSAKGDDTRWAEFTERGQKSLGPIVAKLQREASSSDRTAQFLLWSSRDCLPKMFLDARKEPSESETQLAEYLANVDNLRKGQPVYGGNLRAPRRNGHVEYSSSSWFTDDPMMTSLGIAFTVVNLAVVGWILTSLFKKPSTTTLRE